MCPKAGDPGSSITVSIWTFAETSKLFSDSFKSDLYFENFAAKWTKDASLIIYDEKTGKTIKFYNQIGHGKWTR